MKNYPIYKVSYYIVKGTNLFELPTESTVESATITIASIIGVVELNESVFILLK